MCLLQSFIAVPIVASGSSSTVIGMLSFGCIHLLDWDKEWWMPSIQLICGWAAGALPQSRAFARVSFFDLLSTCQDLDSLARAFVFELPSVLNDGKLNSLECRLALVSSRQTIATIYVDASSSSSSNNDSSESEVVVERSPSITASDQTANSISKHSSKVSLVVHALLHTG